MKVLENTYEFVRAVGLEIDDLGQVLDEDREMLGFACPTCAGLRASKDQKTKLVWWLSANKPDHFGTCPYCECEIC